MKQRKMHLRQKLKRKKLRKKPQRSNKFVMVLADYPVKSAIF
jgi:hypothetical protein